MLTRHSFHHGVKVPTSSDGDRGLPEHIALQRGQPKVLLRHAYDCRAVRVQPTHRSVGDIGQTDHAIRPYLAFWQSADHDQRAAWMPRRRFAHEIGVFVCPRSTDSQEKTRLGSDILFVKASNERAPGDSVSEAVQKSVSKRSRRS